MPPLSPCAKAMAFLRARNGADGMFNMTTGASVETICRMIASESGGPSMKPSAPVPFCDSASSWRSSSSELTRRMLQFL